LPSYQNDVFSLFSYDETLKGIFLYCHANVFVLIKKRPDAYRPTLQTPNIKTGWVEK